MIAEMDTSGEAEENAAFEEGDVVVGTIVSVDPTSVLVSLPDGRRGAVPAWHFPSPPTVGSQVDVFVERVEGATPVLSKYVADKLRLWDDVRAAVEAKHTVRGDVVSKTKGGLVLDVGLRAFLPAREVGLRQVDDLDAFIGQVLTVQLQKLREDKGSVVVSRRAVLEVTRKEQAKTTRDQLTEGDTVDAEVLSFTDYAAFVDVGGLDGLLHVNDLSWGRVAHPRDVLHIGERLRVKVLKWSRADNKLTVGVKQLHEDPWTTVPDRYPPNTRVRGRVVGLVDYGAFVALDDGVEGLVHISELSWTKRVRHPGDVLQPGQPIEAVVLELDPQKRRLSLGYRQTLPNPWEDLHRHHPVGSTVSGPVKSITDFGAFISVAEGIDGLAHITELTWADTPRHPSELLAVGQTVSAMVQSIDAKNQRLSLSVRELQENPWKSFARKYPKGTKVSGVVKRVQDTGAVVEIEPGFDGFCHISQLSPERVERVTEVTRPGHTLEAAVLEVDVARQRVSLSVRALTRDAGDWRQYLPKEDGHEGPGALAQALSHALGKENARDD